jgi:hypothetical protein
MPSKNTKKGDLPTFGTPRGPFAPVKPAGSVFKPGVLSPNKSK